MVGFGAWPGLARKSKLRCMNTETQFKRASRLGRVQVSEIVQIAEAARERRAAGEDVIGLGTGEPSFDTPAHIKEAAAQAMAAGDTKYPTNVGNQHDNVYAGLDGTRQFLTSHLKTPIPGDTDDGAFRLLQFRRNGRRQSVTHRAGHGRELRAVATVTIVAVEPARIVSSAVGDDGIMRQALIQMRDHLTQLHGARTGWRIRAPRKIVFTRLDHMRSALISNTTSSRFLLH